MLKGFANQNAHLYIKSWHVYVVFFLRMLKIPTQKGEHSSKCPSNENTEYQLYTWFSKS